jgi:MraZ protein
MKQLFGTHENRLDGKGRVSVPAAFRNAWKDESGMTLILRPSMIAGCIEGWPLPNYAKYEAQLAAMEEADPERQGFATKIYSDAVELEMDGQGRILLPDHLIEEAQLEMSGPVCFLGRGTHFHIWTQEGAKAFLAATRALAPRLTFGAPAPQAAPKESL